MDLILFTITNDWHVLTPIVLCSVLVVAVAIERWLYYNRNRCDVIQFIQRLQRELHRDSLENAQIISAQLNNVVGEVSEEGVRVLAENPSSFDRSFDITVALAVRKLSKNLSILGTIATIAPYLGLFGTVVRILLTFGELAAAGASSGAPQIMFGIGSALIATAFGLGVAILAVTLNNFFQTVVNGYEDDFQLLKLLFLSFLDEEGAGTASGNYNAAMQQAQTARMGTPGMMPAGTPRGGM